MMSSNFASLSQAEINKLPEIDYARYVQDAENNGLIYRFDGKQEGLEIANAREFGTKSYRLFFDIYNPEKGWQIVGRVVEPKWELKPLQMSEQDFCQAMSYMGVPKEVLQGLVSKSKE